MATTWKRVSSSNQLKPDYWKSLDPNNQEILSDLVNRAADLSIDDRLAIAPLCDFIINQIESQGHTVNEAHFIRHAWDAPKGKPNVNPDTSCGWQHLHYYIDLDEKLTPKEWSDLLGMEANFIEPLKRGGSPDQRRSGALAYLIHKKDPLKHQYPPECVYTARGSQEYMDIFYERELEWSQGAVIKQYNKSQLQDSTKLIADDIMNGKTTLKEVLRTDVGRRVYLFNKSILDNASKIASMCRADDANRALENREFSKFCVFLTGQSTSGKTEYAKRLARMIIEAVEIETGERWKCMKAATGSDFISNYAGEEIVIINDLDSSAIRNDNWKMILDPYNGGDIGSRYYNKSLANRITIITSTLSPYDYFYKLKDREEDESIEQHIRRINYAIDVNRIAPPSLDQVDVLPTDDNTRLSLKKVMRHPQDSPVRLKATKPRAKDFSLIIKTCFTLETPKDLPEWMRPSDALQVVLRSALNRSNIDYSLPESTMEGIAASKEDKTEYEYLRPMVNLVPVPPDPAPSKDDALPVKPTQFTQLVINGYVSNLVLDLGKLPIRNDGTPCLDIEYLNDLLESMADECRTVLDEQDEEPPLDFNPFMQPEELENYNWLQSHPEEAEAM